MSEHEDVLRLEGLRKVYNPGTPQEQEVLRGIDLRLSRGELTALIGPSGSGKSTLLNVIGLLDSPSAGELYLMGQPTRTLDDEARTRLRNEAIGFVFQFHHLISAFSVLDNVLMPLMIRRGKPQAEDVRLAEQLLAQVGLGGFAGKRASQLSGGQQQRVAIARALVTRPALLLADEPTGNLDEATAGEVLALLLELVAQAGCALLMVTHSPQVAAPLDRCLVLSRGRLAPRNASRNDTEAGA